MSTYLQTAIEEASGELPPQASSAPAAEAPVAQPQYYTPRYAHVMDSLGGSKAPKDTRKLDELRDVHASIRATAARQAKAPLTVTPSRFLDRLRDHYLKAYLAAPSAQAGVAAIAGIGKPFAG